MSKDDVMYMGENSVMTMNETKVISGLRDVVSGQELRDVLIVELDTIKWIKSNIKKLLFEIATKLDDLDTRSFWPWVRKQKENKKSELKRLFYEIGNTVLSLLLNRESFLNKEIEKSLPLEEEKGNKTDPMQKAILSEILGSHNKTITESFEETLDASKNG